MTKFWTYEYILQNPRKHLGREGPLKIYSCRIFFNHFLFNREPYCARSVQTSFTQNCLKTSIPGFPYTLLPFFCGDIGFKKKHGSILTWKSALKVTLLPLRASCHLQTIMLRAGGNLFSFLSVLQIVMAVWHTLMKIWRAPNSSHTRPSKLKLKKGSK